MSKLWETVKHVVVEDTPEKDKSPKVTIPAAQPSAPTPATVPTFGFNTAAIPAMTPVAVTENADIYNRIASKTDFDMTQAGITLKKYSDPLISIILDPGTRLKAAIAQATGDGLTVDKVLATFDGLKVALANEVSAFNDKAQQQTDHEVTAREQKIQELTAQMTSIQQQLGQLSNDKVMAQGKIATATQQFSMAASRRGLELDQQKAQFTALLK